MNNLDTDDGCCEHGVSYTHTCDECMCVTESDCD
jgi:hypothetical protein